MGFGLLFVGYLLAFGFTSGANYIVSAIGLAGATVLFIACRKLSRYSKGFRSAGTASIVLALSYLINAACQLYIKAVHGAVMPEFAVDLSKGLIVTSVFVFHYLMYRGISEIAINADIKKISISSVRNMILMTVYYTVLIISKVLYQYSVKAAGIVSLIGSVLGLMWLLLSVACVLSAYMRICPEGDENMPPRTNAATARKGDNTSNSKSTRKKEK